MYVCMHVHITINTTKKKHVFMGCHWLQRPPKPKRDLNPCGFQRAPGKRFCQVTIKKDRTVPDFSRSILRKNYKLATFHIFIYFFPMGMFIESKYKKLPVQSISASANPHFRWPPEKCASKFRGFIHGWFSINNHSYQGLLTIYVNISPKCFSAFMGFFLLVYPLLYLT
jgi:hypothetical protein